MSNPPESLPPWRPPPAPRSTGMIEPKGASLQAGDGRDPGDPGATTTSLTRPRSMSAPVQPEQIRDRTVVSVDDSGAAVTSASGTIKAGALRPPGELGVEQNSGNVNSPTNKSIDPGQQKIQAHPATLAARKRVQNAVKRGHEIEEYQAKNHPFVTKGPASHVTSFCYNGTEILMASWEHFCFVLCARTRFVFQQLQRAKDPCRILSLHSHPQSGQVCVSYSNGKIQIFRPAPTDPKEVCFGRYRWLPGPVIDAARIFFDPSDTTTTPIFDEEHPRLEISQTADGKVLVAYNDQMAVFDGARKAELLWTTQLPGDIVTAKISGDGYSIAVVLHYSREDNEEDARAATDGVHTFERDLEDGSDHNSRKKGKVQWQGILYKPGPFLVHTAPVTSLAFRGQGHVSSSTLADGQGNDLLLTHCASDATARIFGQNNWKPLTEWTTSSNTRVAWVEGISAFALGDLESMKKPNKTSASDNAGDIQESLGKLHSTGPSHTAPSTNAGAWVVEISFQEPYPALRLSRLSYLKRGVDDLSPTLLESVSSFIPVNCVFADRILTSASGTLHVAGVWPAWNPWLSESTDVDTSETLKGSAMTFLGLSSGPPAGGGGGGGFVGEDGLIGGCGVQGPPNELRIVSPHALSGQVVVLEFSLFGDKAMTAMDLGNPIRNVLSIARLCPRTEATKLAVASMQYDDTARLVAEVLPDKRSLSLSLRKSGTMTFLPTNWMSEDAVPERAAELLENSTHSLRDESIIPPPFVLPYIHIQGDLAAMEKDDSIIAVLWWSDSTFGGSPLIVAVTSAGAIIIAEVAPPWSSFEPPMPDFGKPPPLTMTFDFSGVSPSESFGEQSDQAEQQYEVLISPDPEYGLGLRLESHVDGNSAVAGSFKHHPLTGESLPAEKTGMIRIGDELLSANDMVLEAKPFDEIIAAVREVGSSSGPGNPIRMKFRRVPQTKLTKNGSFVSAPSHRRSGSQASDISQRRTFEQMFGVTPGDIDRKITGIAVRNSAFDKDNFVMDDAVKPGDSLANHSIVAAFPNAVSVGAANVETNVDSLQLIPFEAIEQNAGSSVESRTAILFFLSGCTVNAAFLSMSTSNQNRSSCVQLEGYECSSDHESESLARALHVAESGHHQYCIAVCMESGEIHLVGASVLIAEPTKIQLSYKGCSMLRLKRPWLSDCRIQLYSADLLATMQPGPDGVSDTITVWSADPQPSSIANDSVQEIIDKSLSEYFASEIEAEYCSDGNEFLDFFFIRSGFLDSLPSLATFSLKGASLFSKSCGSEDWLPSAQISYSGLPWSETERSIGSLRYGSDCLEISDNPRDMFPHLTPGLCSVASSLDELGSLRSDWHPDSLLAHICAEKRGAKIALKGRVRSMFLWLCSEGKDIPEGHLEGRLAVSQLSMDDITVDDTDDPGPSTSESLMQALSVKKPKESPEKSRIQEFQALLVKSITDSSSFVQNCNSMLEDSLLSERSLPENVISLPAVLRTLGVDDLKLLWALGQVLLNPPSFNDLDSPAQLFLFAASFFRNLRQAPEEKSEKSRGVYIPAHGMMVRTKSSVKDSEQSSFQTISSAGALAAFLSCHQSQLLQSSRDPDHKLSWSLVREYRVVFWERSDAELARLSEEIGQCIFRDTRDSMECALFFIVARKVRTLRNLAATDQSDSGRKFFKFLTQYDFASEKGRRAAEKNAFSLLRKCRYRVAAAFFLLASPPFLTSALETIATKMRDVDLAFLVARLMESPELSKGAESLSASNAFGGILGGGGGYASGGGIITETGQVKQDSPFAQWRPSLGKLTRKLVVERILPSVQGDNVMTAILLLWLQKKEEACWFLSGDIEAAYAGIHVPSYHSVHDVSYKLFTKLRKTSGGNIKSTRESIEVANSWMNFTAASFLLDSFDSSPRVRVAAALHSSSVLNALGMELESTQTLIQYAYPNESESEDKASDSVNDEKPEQNGVTNTEPRSSIFDQFDTPATRANPQSSTADAMQSSIFDNFAGPPTASEGSGAMKSSIFDGFDAPPTSQKPQESSSQKSPSTPGDMQSSIFDDFGGPPSTTNSQLPKTQPKNTNDGAMQSSIFDQFDAPEQPQNPVAPVVSQSGMMESSVFDGYDIAPKPPSGAVAPAPQPSSLPTGAAESPQVSCNNAEPVENDVAMQVDLTIRKCPTPRLWEEWRSTLLLDAAARRFLREVATTLAQFYGDPAHVSIHSFYRSSDKMVTPGVSEVLQLPCDSDKLVGDIKTFLMNISSRNELDPLAVVQQTFKVLGSNRRRRTLLSVVLHLAAGRADLAESIVRFCAARLIQRCHVFALAYDELVHQRTTRSYVSTQFIRREATRLSWQLESCLWLHRGGGLPLSGAALNEAVVAVRVGFLLASWNRNYTCLKTMIQSEPDCIVDEDAGRQLWTSLKITESPGSDSLTKKTTSGGWEFLVDCKRSQATELLRERLTGCFIIRPHAQNHGVFTLSFKTNLVPASDVEEDKQEKEVSTLDTSGDEMIDGDTANRSSQQPKKTVRKDDVVQHAIIRLSDSGFRCGSFGPFTSLITLLEAVSSSLPFKLRFDLPPRNRVIKEEGTQTSPNAVFLRKLSLQKASSLVANAPTTESDFEKSLRGYKDDRDSQDSDPSESDSPDVIFASYGVFLQLVVLCRVRRQMCSIASVAHNDGPEDTEEDGHFNDNDVLSTGSHSGIENGFESESQFVVASRTLSPLLHWCRALEIATVHKLAPDISQESSNRALVPQENFAKSSVTESDGDAIEVAVTEKKVSSLSGDKVLRGMIQQGSAVEFSTLRLVDNGECTMIVLFSRAEAIRWIVSSDVESSEEEAGARLDRMERERIIEPIDLSDLPLKQKSVDIKEEGVRYRFVDPWEVEAVSSREGETKSAALGRGSFVGFSLGRVALATENIFRILGGVPLLELWATAKGSVALTKAIATVYPPWELTSSGDLQLKDGVVTEPPPYINSIRQSLYRNALYRRLNLPQRFLALVQVELLDLKNLTTPGGTLALNAYALLRLKRAGSGGTLTNKARTIDSAATVPMKLNKTSGPNAPASWGSVVRFRFPLPEDVAIDGTSYDRDRETLFKGAPSVLQVSVYEKKLLVDHSLGTADISTDGLGAGGQLEEWVPLRSEKRSITWFARIRLTLRFELMCIAPENSKNDAELVPSVGLQKIEKLCHAGGSAHEDIQKRSLSSPDLISYFEGIVY